jgi:hypothetical protein
MRLWGEGAGVFACWGTGANCIVDHNQRRLARDTCVPSASCACMTHLRLADAATAVSAGCAPHVSCNYGGHPVVAGFGTDAALSGRCGVQTASALCGHCARDAQHATSAPSSAGSVHWYWLCTPACSRWHVPCYGCHCPCGPAAACLVVLYPAGSTEAQLYRCIDVHPWRMHIMALGSAEPQAYLPMTWWVRARGSRPTTF